MPFVAACHHRVADLLGVGGGLEEVGRQRRLSTGVLHGHLALRLEGDGIVEDAFHVVERQLVDVSNLIGVHEARVAHHVAAVRQVDRQHGATAVLDRGSPVAMDQVVAQGPIITSWKTPLYRSRELRVDREQVFKRTVLLAILADENLAVFLDEVRLDLAHVAVHQIGDVSLSADDLLPGLDNTAGTKGVGLARIAEGRHGTLVRLEQRSRCPSRGRRLAVRQSHVHALEELPGEFTYVLK